MPQYANVDANDLVDIRNDEGILSSLFRIAITTFACTIFFQKMGASFHLNFQIIGASTLIRKRDYLLTSVWYHILPSMVGESQSYWYICTLLCYDTCLVQEENEQKVGACRKSLHPTIYSLQCRTLFISCMSLIAGETFCPSVLRS